MNAAVVLWAVAALFLVWQAILTWMVLRSRDEEASSAARMGRIACAMSDLIDRFESSSWDRFQRMEALLEDQVHREAYGHAPARPPAPAAIPGFAPVAPPPAPPPAWPSHQHHGHHLHVAPPPPPPPAPEPEEHRCTCGDPRCGRPVALSSVGERGWGSPRPASTGTRRRSGSRYR